MSVFGSEQGCHGGVCIAAVLIQLSASVSLPCAYCLWVLCVLHLGGSIASMTQCGGGASCPDAFTPPAWLNKLNRIDG